MIILKNLSKSYCVNQQNITALSTINLHIKPGEICGIVGKSGAGKSTLLRCVNLLERPSAGSVHVDNIDLCATSISELRAARKNIGMIFQHFNLLESCTAFENVAMPLRLLGADKKVIHDKVTELLALVELDDRYDHYPRQLSGGQKQRVAIARALATDPHVLLCDEATSSLDPESTVSILKLLKKINQQLNLTILLITHELDVVKRICDRVAILHAGQLIEEGSALSVFSDPQHAVTKQLLQLDRDFELPEQSSDTNVCLARLTFVGTSSDEPVISKIIKSYDIKVNFLQAHIENIQETTMGTMVCQFSGAPDVIESALQDLKSDDVKVEVLS
jgi:D-methionine transport system ATP-binding protein